MKIFVRTLFCSDRRHRLSVNERITDLEKNFVCFFTGHREINASHAELITVKLDETLETLIKNGVTVFRAGGALGFDTLAALKVIEKKKIYPFVRLELFLPCKDQADNWRDFDKDIYEYVLKYADDIIYTSESYHRGCMHLRNRKMTDGSDFCVAYLYKNVGGTAYTMDYASKKGVKIINLVNLWK